MLNEIFQVYQALKVNNKWNKSINTTDMFTTHTALPIALKSWKHDFQALNFGRPRHKQLEVPFLFQ
jgi:glucan phosphorylase